MVTLNDTAVEAETTTETGKKPYRKIAIVGTAPSSNKLAPYEDKSWEIWAMGRNAHVATQALLSINNQIRLPPGHEDRILADRPRRFDKWYEIHTKSVLEACDSWPVVFPFFQQIGDKLTLGHDIPELPHAKQMDKDRLFRNFKRKYFASSIDYMLAEAILEEPDEIGIWGVDMIVDGEYQHQKPSCEYYLGMAEGKGIKVFVPEASSLLRCDRLYGLEHKGLSREILLMEKEINGAMANAEDQKYKAVIHEAEVRGRKLMLAEISRRWG